MNAATVVAGLASNSVAQCEWSTYPFGAVDVSACHNATVDAAERVTGGDLGGMKALLAAQTVTLNALFTDLAARAHKWTTIESFERYLRLALKAQSNCRATVETVATIKNPPVLFARQANIAHGPQQVNNALAGPAYPPALARAENSEIEQSKLLEPGTHAERLDGGTTGAASERDSELASLGAVDGPGDGGGQGAIGKERGPRRRVAAGARAARLATSMAPRRT